MPQIESSRGGDIRKGGCLSQFVNLQANNGSFLSLKAFLHSFVDVFLVPKMSFEMAALLPKPKYLQTSSVVFLSPM